MSALVFLDTETTGLAPDDDIWEFAAIRRGEDGVDREHHMFLAHDPAKCAQLPEQFLADHRRRFPGTCAAEHGHSAVHPSIASRFIDALFRDRPHVVGAVPSFDTERLAILLRRHGYWPRWHYHLIDVENLAVGYLAGEIHAERIYGLNPRRVLPVLPWDSDELSRRVGVEPRVEGRHTAMGDARWARDLYDAITKGATR